MHKQFQDAMLYVVKFGSPNLFVTITCNPKWKQINNCLFPGQKASHQHDIIA